MATATLPYDWIKDVPRSLLERDGVPLFGKSPAFPWDAFQQSLNALFQTEGLHLHPVAPQWREADDVTAGINNPVVLSFNVEPMRGVVYWLLSNEDISILMFWLLQHTTGPLKTVQDPSLREGFYQFLAVECCHLIAQSQFDVTLTPKVIREAPLPEDVSLCMDMGVQYQNQEIRGRLVLSNEFYQSWKEYYANRMVSIPLPDKLTEQVELTVSLEAGRTVLSKQEWTQVAPGDFVALDFCSLQPPGDKGRVVLVVNGVPLFRGKRKRNGIKILELPLFYEVETTMNTGNPNGYGGLNGNGKPNDDDDLLSLLPEDEQLQEQAEEGPEGGIGAHGDEGVDHDEVSEFEESHIEESVGDKSMEESSSAPIETKKVDLDELPVCIKIEVGRLQMSVKKLLELQSGNILELDIHPEDGVDLIVHNRCVGKGELIRLGDMIGVRILDILP